MDAYDKGLEERIAEWAVKKYKSHRRLPDNINEFFDNSFRAKLTNLTSHMLHKSLIGNDGERIYYYKKYSNFKTFQLSVETFLRQTSQ